VESVNGLDVAALKHVFAALAAAMEAHRDELTELDGRMGDGDLGLTLSRGFSAVAEAAQAFEGDDCGALIARMGQVMNKAASSTMGTLLAMGMMRAGKGLEGKSRLETADMAAALTTAAEAIKRVGRADVGDKTMLDCLVPAANALTAKAEEGASLPEAWQAAVAAAEAGLAETTDLPSKVGRAGWFGEKTRGIADPGARACVIMLQAVGGALTKERS